MAKSYTRECKLCNAMLLPISQSKRKRGRNRNRKTKKQIGSGDSEELDYPGTYLCRLQRIGIGTPERYGMDGHQTSPHPLIHYIGTYIGTYISIYIYTHTFNTHT